MRSILRIGETAIQMQYQTLAKEDSKQNSIVFGTNIHILFHKSYFFRFFSHIRSCKSRDFKFISDFSPNFAAETSTRAHFLYFCPARPRKKTNRDSDDEKITDPAPAHRLLVAGRSPGTATPNRPAPGRNHYGRFDLRTDRATAQHAQHRGREGHHVPP